MACRHDAPVASSVEPARLTASLSSTLPMKKNALTIALLIAAAAVPAGAQTLLLEYSADASGTNQKTASYVDPAVTAASLVAGTGLTVNTGSTFNFRTWNTSSTSFEAAVAANDFWSWGFSVAAPSTSITLGTMDLRLDRSGTGPDDFEIRASVNGGSAVSILSHDYKDTDAAVDFLNVSLAALGTVSTGDVVSFTLGAFNSESASGTFDLETIGFSGENPRGLQIHGTVIPEPSTYAALAGLFTLGVVAVRRRLRA